MEDTSVDGFPNTGEAKAGAVVGTAEVLMVEGALNIDVEENKEPDAEASAEAVDCCPKKALEGEGFTADEGVTPKSEEAAEEGSWEGCWPKTAVLAAAEPKPPNEGALGPRGDAKKAGGVANPPIPDDC